MNVQPNPLDSRDPEMNVFVRIAAFLPPECQPRFWAFITDWAARVGPNDRLFLIVEAMAYMVLSIHDVPGQMEQLRALIKKDVKDSEEIFKAIRRAMTKTAARSIVRMQKATRALVHERERYDRGFQEGFKCLEDKMTLRLAAMPWAYAHAIISTATEWFKEHSRELIVMGVIPLLGIVGLSFYAGYWFGHAH